MSHDILVSIAGARPRGEGTDVSRWKQHGGSDGFRRGRACPEKNPAAGRRRTSQAEKQEEEQEEEIFLA
jgi:hypothetical protein